MRSAALITLLAFHLFACRSGELSGGVESEKLKTKTNSGSTQTDANTHTPDSAVSEITVPLAEAPVVVASATLTCVSSSASGADCQIKRNDILADIPFVKAYVIKSSDLIWSETSFQRLAPGQIHIDYPPMSGGLAIALRNNAKENLATWVVPPPEPERNVVKNGSFEDYIVGSNGYYYSSNFDSGYWQARLSINSPCTVPSLEVFAPQSPFMPAHERNIMDLNSTCIPSNGLENEVFVWQNLTTKPGHLYELVYTAAGNPFEARSRILVKFSNNQLFERDFAGGSLNPNWENARALLRSTGSVELLEFSDAIITTSGNGPLLDNVRVYDLGTGPT